MPDPVQQQLQTARERLLDLNLTNRLLNYRAPKTGSVRVVDERIDSIWELIVKSSRTMEFLAKEEHEFFDSAKSTGTSSLEEDEVADDQPFALPEIAPQGASGSEARRYTDRFLQTAHEGTHLQTRLLRLHQLAQSAIEETGVNVLFLAMGFLQWLPSDRKDAVRAPLLLIPVTLDRSSAGQRFTLKCNGDQPVFNPCLPLKLQRDFRISLDPEPQDWEAFVPDTYFNSVRQAIEQEKTWAVLENIYLGIFSFTKYLMYADLDQKNWPAGRGPEKNPLVRAMCGDRQALTQNSSVLPKASEMDHREEPSQIFHVVDADSSQHAAIAAAKDGTSLVIQGPPGTGKSQTITNLIAECLAQDKSVLFVSQKKAALEVVQRRLQKVGLGDFCLELHSTKAHRSAVLTELERVLSLQSTPRPDADHKFDRYKYLRERLNGYVKALHAPLGKAGWTAYKAIGRLALLSEVPNMISTISGVEAWTHADVETNRNLIQSFRLQLEAVWPPKQHVWQGCRKTNLSMQARRDMAEALKKTIVALNASASASRELAQMLGFSSTSGSPQSTSIHVDVGELVLQAPPISLALIDDDRWDSVAPEVNEMLGIVKSYEELQAAVKSHYRIDQAQTIEWRPLLERATRRGFGRMLTRSYWRDRSVVQQVVEPGYKPTQRQLVEDLQKLSEMNRLAGQIADRSESGRRWFDTAWQGISTSPSEVVKTGNWLLKARNLARNALLPVSARTLCHKSEGHGPLRASVTRAKDSLQAFTEHFQHVKTIGSLQDPGLFPTSTVQQTFEPLADRLSAMLDDLELLVTWSQYQEALQRCEQAPVAALVTKMLELQLEPEVYGLAFEKQMLLQLVEHAMSEHEVLRTFNARLHEQQTLEFARLDTDLICENRHRLYGKLAAVRPQNGFAAAKSSQLGIIQSEIRRRRGGRTIRGILQDAGEVVRHIKPCFMMSPLSVAQYMAPKGLPFDIVIFDEASQVEPPDALGAIARAGQLVLVGDRKQLPPTNFFAGLDGDDEATKEGEAALTDMESILDRGEAVLPAVPLRWHYRSRHESLISFSNSEFYNNELVVFPSAHNDREQLGVSLRHDATDFYDRAKSRTNRQQAKKVAKAVFDHFRTSPSLGDPAFKSVGVVAFSAAQQQAIQDEIEGMRRSDPSLEDFFRIDGTEPFFVKNLETVQGDERDIMLLSVGHGRASAGERVGASISNLNGEDGWRRLNVLVTRARERYLVFTSILGGDMDLTGTRARGVHAFKKYLEFAETGKLPVIQTSDGEFGSPFEQAVFNALTERGVQLHKQVGCVGYAIDLAVVDPLKPGQFILGIECDGATYHGSSTARDRDRLRQQVLESLGWRIHRIWSTDWFHRQKTELERVLEAIEKARAGQLQPRFTDIGSAVHQPTIISTREIPETCAPLPPIPSQPYRCYEARSAGSTEDFYIQPDHLLAELIVRIVGIEGPIHQEELSRRVSEQFGLGRLGNRIAEKITRAIQWATRNDRISKREDFLWPHGMVQPTVRTRNDPMNRNIDTVASEEILRVVMELVSAQVGIERSDLIKQTARVLGFSAGGSRTKVRIDEIITATVQAGRLGTDLSGRFSLPP